MSAWGRDDYYYYYYSLGIRSIFVLRQAMATVWVAIRVKQQLKRGCWGQERTRDKTRPDQTMDGVRFPDNCPSQPARHWWSAETVRLCDSLILNTKGINNLFGAYVKSYTMPFLSVPLFPSRWYFLQIYYSCCGYTTTPWADQIDVIAG